MNQPEQVAPIQNGHVAEAIAQHVLGNRAKWIGGRNPGHDLILDDIKIDVKSGVRKLSIFRSGADREDCVGIRLNKGVEGLADQDVDEIVVIVRDDYGDSVSRISVKGDTAKVELAVNVNGLAVYRIPVADVARIFRKPFKRDGSLRKSVQNVDAPTGDLESFRMSLDGTTAEGDVVEFRSGLSSGGKK